MATHDSVFAVGVFDNLDKAERTIEELRRAGFSSEEIGIIGHVGEGQQGMPAPPEVKAPERNAIQLLITGAIVGALVGTLVIAVIPGLGWVSGAGRAFEILGGALLGAISGGVLLALGLLPFTRRRARFFARELERGRFIVTVKNPERHQEAISLLRRQGVHAQQIAE